MAVKQKTDDLLLGTAASPQTANAQNTNTAAQTSAQNNQNDILISTQGAQNASANPVTGLSGVESGEKSDGNNSPALMSLPGISDATKQALGGLTSGYKPSQTVADAMTELQGIISNQPAAFQSQYMSQLNGIMNKILGRESFAYDPYSDPLYLAYKDNYQQQGWRAMMDTMGQASQLTGGYGNSYASTAGNQAYQGYMTQLNDKLPDLYNMALQGYQTEGDRLSQQYNMLGDAYSREQSEYDNAYNRWATDRDYYSGRYDTERNLDYSNYGDMLNYWQNQANAENSQYNNDRSYYYDYLMQMIAAGKNPSADLINKSGLSADDVASLVKAYSKSSGGSSSGKTTYSGGSGASAAGNNSSLNWLGNLAGSISNTVGGSSKANPAPAADQFVYDYYQDLRRKNYAK